MTAARWTFGAAGYAGATIRAIAGRAGVDPAIVGVLANHLDRPDARLRATLIGSQLIGTGIIRYVLLWSRSRAPTPRR